MVAGNHHQRFQNDTLVIACLYLCQNVIQRRLSFNSADKVVGIAVLGQQILHLLIYLIGICLSAVTHKADGSLAVIVGGSPLGDRLFHSGEIVVAVQKRLSEYHLIEGIRIIADLFHQLVIFQTVHQVGGLYDQILDAVVDGTLQCSIDIVDEDVVPSLHVVDDDVGGKAAADREVRKCLFQIAFDCADGQTAAGVVAGAEAEYQQLVVADVVLIADVIQRSVASIVILVVVHGFLLRSFCGCLCHRGAVRSRAAVLCGRVAGITGTAGQHAGNQCQRKHKNSGFFHDKFSLYFR